jgi:predicted SAM-dependent methyltransferase
MHLTLDIPDEMAQWLTANGQNPSCAAVEALAIERYRSGALTASQARRRLGFETRYELDGFLKSHNVWEHAYDIEDLEHHRETLRLLRAQGRLKTA